MLHLGTQTDNTKDAHDNGKYDGKKNGAKDKDWMLDFKNILYIVIENV